MGRQSGYLVLFFKEALATSKYINLKPVGNATNTYMLYFPRMLLTLDRTYQHILKDYENLRKREYIYSESYSSVKQRIRSEIRQSDYLELVSSKDGKIIFRILEPEEVKEKKLKKKIRNARRHLPLSGFSDDNSTELLTVAVN